MTAIHLEAPHGRLRRVPRYSARETNSNVTGRIVATLREWRRRARDRAELGKLDDRMLKDIGLTRAAAEFLSNKPFWRE
jgi:uncharacterized protein YjiS (DUF1127 family)